MSKATQTDAPAAPKPFQSQSAVRAAEMAALELRIGEAIDKRQRATAKEIAALKRRISVLEKARREA